AMQLTTVINATLVGPCRWPAPRELHGSPADRQHASHAHDLDIAIEREPESLGMLRREALTNGVGAEHGSYLDLQLVPLTDVPGAREMLDVAVASISALIRAERLLERGQRQVTRLGRLQRVH